MELLSIILIVAGLMVGLLIGLAIRKRRDAEVLQQAEAQASAWRSRSEACASAC